MLSSSSSIGSSPLCARVASLGLSCFRPPSPVLRLLQLRFRFGSVYRRFAGHLSWVSLLCIWFVMFPFSPRSVSVSVVVADAFPAWPAAARAPWIRLLGIKMSYSLLKDLPSHTQKWRIKVRVVRFSEFLSNDQPPKVNRLHFVLLDEKANIVTEFSKIPASFSDTFPLYACDIVPFATLLSKIDEIDLSDTIGLITECAPPRIEDTRTGRRALRKIYITDGRYAYMMRPVLLIGDAPSNVNAQPTTVTELFNVEDHTKSGYCLSLLGVEPGALEDPNAPNIDLVCFGQIAEQLIGAPVLALLGVGGNAGGFILPPITRCFGRQYQFRLSVPQTALGRDRPSFKIDAIEATPAIFRADNVAKQTGILRAD
ncbi:hypothetical protein EJB05_35195 [Eragrostis curvula]|uniref:DUF223 domain-containing protein n=1 Tax=Eragrostis curvula TaxID=38414 RepID=A0A5J9U659_9POAL|nr:hypothetical protein EJB05_35195 [Eragrostis curvula]